MNLSASAYFVPDSGSMRYLNYGAAVSEVNFVTSLSSLHSSKHYLASKEITINCVVSELTDPLFVPQVELNLLTGETTILQSDIIYDCGQSLNPAIDLGQVIISSILIMLI